MTETPPAYGHYVLTLNQNGFIIDIDHNPFAGYPVKELEHQDILKLIHPEEKNRVEKFIRQAAEENKIAANVLHRILSKDGHWHWYTTSFIPTVAAETRKKQIIAVTGETAPPEKAENPDQPDFSSYYNLFYNHPLPIFVFDAGTLQFLAVNESALRHYGYSREEFLKMYLFHLQHEDNTAHIIRESKKHSFYTGENKHWKKNGDIIDVDIAAHKTVYQDRQAWMATVNDITERKKAEQEVTESELRYKMFIQNSSEAILRFEMRTPVPVNQPETGFIARFYENAYLAECNNAMAEMYGRHITGEMIGITAEQIFPKDHPDSTMLFKQFIRNGFRVKDSVTHEADMNGNARVFSNNYTGIVENGHLLRVWGTKRDITQQTIAEESIHYMASIVDNATDAICSLTPERKVIFWNKACEELTGVRASEITGHTVRHFFTYRYATGSLKEMKASVTRNGSWKGEVVLENKRNGRSVLVLVTIIGLKDDRNKLTRLLVFSKDISERKKAENLLKESEQRFKTMADSAPAMIYMVNEKEWPVYFNSAWLRFTGRTLEEEIKSNIDFNIHPDDVQRVKQTYYRNTLTRKPFEVEYRLRNHEGRFRWIVDRASPRYLEDGTYVGYTGIGYDIQDRKEAEEERLKHAEYISSILDSITDGFLAMDNNYIITMWNGAAEQLFNIKAGDVIGKPAHTNFKSYKNTPGAIILNQALLQRKVAQFEEYIPETNKWAEANVFPFSGGFFVYFRDVSARKRREMLLELQTKALKAGSGTSASLQQIADVLSEGLEKIFPGIVSSVYQADEASGRLEILSAPSLPGEYWQLVNGGGTVHPDEFPCVKAAVTKKPVIVSDVQDTRWYKFRKVADVFELRSAYAFPVLSANDKVLAVLSTYYKKPYKADAYELDILQQLANLFALILEKRMVEEKIKVTHERYEFIKSATNEMIWGIDLKTGKVELSDGWTRLFGYDLPVEDVGSGFGYEKAHPDDREKAKEFFSNIQKNNKSRVTEYRLQKADGTYAFVQATAYLITNDLEEPVRLIGSIKDITKQKELEQQLLLEEINKQKIINEAILEGSERQRSEISKELHDNVSQILSSAKLYLEITMKKEKIQSELFNRGIEFINEGINEIRKLSHTLAPPGLRQLGLQDAIEEHLRNLQMVHQMKISFTFNKSIEKLASEELKLSLYRIIQEQLNNIVKYARAQKVKIRLAKEKKQLIFSIADNGVGFDPDKVKKGLGLANIVNRAALFEGSASIDSSPGKGCRVTISIPLN